MNRFALTIFAIVTLTSWAPSTLAQDPNNASAIADRQEADEKYRRMNSAVEELLASQVALQKRLASASEEIQRLREEVERSKASPSIYASVDDLRRLADKVQEIDKKREADKSLILDEIKKLARMPAPVAHEAAPPKTSKNAPKVKENGFEYEVQKGDSLSKIAAECRKQGIKVTTDEILKANPGLKQNTVYVGRKIFIPDTSKAGGAEK